MDKGMDKTTRNLLLITFALEAIGWGLQMTGVAIPVIGWFIVALGFIVLAVAITRMIKKKDKDKQPKLTEIAKHKEELEERIKARKQYLPQLKQLIGDYINHVELLAKTDDKVLDLERYKKVYTVTKLFKRLSRGDESGALIGELIRQHVWKNNLIFREIEDEDKTLLDISPQIDNYASYAKDKKVVNYTKGFRLAAHIAYSYVVFCMIIRKHYSRIPPTMKVYFNLEREAINKFREHQNNINKHIDELIEEGTEDE